METALAGRAVTTMRRQRSEEEKPVVELLEEAFHLVRQGPGLALTTYCVGTLPFLLGFLYFWSDMARSAFAEERLALGSIGLTMLFLWMKVGHGLCTQRWLAWLNGEAPPRWTLRRLVRIATRQIIVQP